LLEPGKGILTTLQEEKLTRMGKVPIRRRGGGTNFRTEEKGKRNLSSTRREEGGGESKTDRKGEAAA